MYCHGYCDAQSLVALVSPWFFHAGSARSHRNIRESKASKFLRVRCSFSLKSFHIWKAPFLKWSILFLANLKKRVCQLICRGLVSETSSNKSAIVVFVWVSRCNEKVGEVRFSSTLWPPYVLTPLLWFLETRMHNAKSRDDFFNVSFYQKTTNH